MPPVVVLRLLPARAVNIGVIRRGNVGGRRLIKRAGVEQFIKQQRITRQLARYRGEAAQSIIRCFQRRGNSLSSSRWVVR